MTKFYGDRSVRILIHGALMALGLASGALAQQQPVLTERDTFSMDLGSEKRPTKHWRHGANHPKGLIHYWLVTEPVNGGVRISEMATVAGFKVLGVHRDLGKMVYKVELNTVDGADAAETRLKAFPEFFSLEPVQNQDKIHHDLVSERTDRTQRKWARSASGDKDPMMDSIRVHITHAPMNVVDLLVWARKMGIRNVKVVSNTVLEGDVQWSQLDALSASPIVHSVDRQFEPQILNDVTRSILGFGALQYGAPASGFLDTTTSLSATWNDAAANAGKGVIVGVFDNGVDSMHPDLRISPSLGRKAVLPSEVWWAGSGAAGWSHATHVAGTILGNGALSLANGGRAYQWRGEAPKAQLFSLQADWNTHSVDAGNFSVVLGGFNGAYDAYATVYDALIADHVGARPVYVMAEGNNGSGAQYGAQQGYFSALNALKNGIKVGAVDKGRLHVADFSSLGPTRDGRLGPDVVAPGAGATVHGTVTVTEISGFRAGNTFRNFWNNSVSTLYSSANVRGVIQVTYTPNQTIFSGGRKMNVRGPIQTVTPAWVVASGDSLRVNFTATATGHATLYVLYTDGTNNVFSDVSTGVVQPVKFQFPSDAIGKTVSQAGFYVDLVGTEIKSAGAYTDAVTLAKSYGYTEMEGTSMATPAVTGIVALMLERYGKLTGKNIHTNRFWNSTAKAILVHTAQDLVSTTPDPDLPNNPDFYANAIYKDSVYSNIYGAGPDWASGYGLVNAANAVAITGTNKVLEDTVDQGVAKSYTVTLPSGLTTFRATLAWDDPASTGNTQMWQKALVNDLDLTMTSPTGVVSRPWVLDAGPINDSLVWSNGIDPRVTVANVRNNPAHKGIDSLNNLEVVDLTNPVAGVWTITVTPRLLGRSQHPATQSGLHQDFSLVTDLAATPITGGPSLPPGSTGWKFNNPTSTLAVILADGSIWMKDCTGTVPVTGGFAWWFGGLEKASLLPTSGLRSTTYASAQSAWLAVAANNSGGALVVNPLGVAMFRVGQDASIRVAGVSNCSATGF